MKRMRFFMLLVVIATLLICSGAAFGNLFGVDVSTYQGTINWDVLKASTNFAIMRSSYGNGGTDGQFNRNRSEARRVGMRHGFYHFAYPQNNTSIAEADWFVNTVGTPQPGELLVLDYEQSLGNQVNWCGDFLDRVYSRTGVKPLIYLNLSTVNAYDWSRVRNSGYGLWIAYWDGSGNPAVPSNQWGFNTIKQYSDSGNVGGISPVDLDVFNGDSWGTGGTDGPAAVSSSSTRQDVFVRGSLGRIHQKTWTPSTGWGSWNEFPTFTNTNMAPTVCSWGTNRLDLFNVDPAGGVWWSYYNGSAWSNWAQFAGTQTICPLAACSMSSGRIDLFDISPGDHKIYQKTYSNGAWGAGWTVFPTFTNTNLSPAVCSWGANRMDLFNTAPGGQIYWSSYNGSTWSNWWMFPGSNSPYSPTACTWGPNRIDMFNVSSGGTVYQTTYNGSSWSGWVNLGGNSIGAASCTTRGPGLLDVFIRTKDNHLMEKSYNNSTWGVWSDLGLYYD